MKKRTLAIVLLLTIIAPFVLFANLERIKDYIPPTEPYKKTPYQFEEAFNEQMAQYGMSIDVSSVSWPYDEYSLYKSVPIQCEDGSTITCTYYPTGKSSKSQIEVIEFEQSLSSKEPQTIYIVPLMEFILQEFEAPMLEDKDKGLAGSRAVSYNEAIRYCQTFVAGAQQGFEFYVASDESKASPVKLQRKNEEEKSIQIRIILFS
ncbi:MAG: hypothetical protein ABFC73_07970 [Clostridiaceae bacterium]